MRRRESSWQLTDVSWTDLKLGLRILRKYPLVSLVSVLPTALAVAGAGGVFAVTDNIVNPRLPLEDGDRVVALEHWNPATRAPEPRALHDFAVWRQELASIEELGAFSTYRPDLTVDDTPPRPVFGARITATGFQLARVPPLLGRYLVEEDGEIGAPDVVVVGHDLWRDRLAGDPNIVGKSIDLSGVSHLVVGVMPRGFAFPFNDELWVPLRDDRRSWEPSEGPPVFMFGRLREGATQRQAQAELTAIASRLAATRPEEQQQLQARIVPYGTNLWTGPTAVFSGLRLALVLLMVIVCATVGALVFVRNLSRQHEVALRRALGASRARIVTQLTLESLATAFVASGVGLVLILPGLRWAYATVSAAQATEGGLPFWVTPHLAPGTIVYVMCLTVLSSVLMGVLPALALTREGSLRVSTDPLGGGIQVTTRAAVAIAGQTALTIGMVTAVYGLWPGIVGQDDRAQVIDGSLYLTAELRPSGVPRSREERLTMLNELMRTTYVLGDRLREEAEVTGVTLASALPGMRHRDYQVEIEGRDLGRGGRTAPAAWIDAHFLDLMGIPVISGRGIEPDDVTRVGSTMPVAVVNRSFAASWFGDRSPIGERIRVVGSNHWDDPWAEIVGVVGDRGMHATDPANPEGIYFAMLTGSYPLRVVLTTRSHPAGFASQLRLVTNGVDPTIRVGGVRMLTDVLEAARAQRRTVYSAAIIATLGVLALSLSAIYAVSSFLVTQRRREIGIRIALGGGRLRVVREVLQRAMRQLAVGVGLGIALMVVLRLITTASVGWGTLAAVSAATVGAGLLACLVPALRAAAISPTDAIRSER